MVSYILFTGYSILLFLNPLSFVAVISKVLLVNLLAALNFANVFLNIKRLENYIYGLAPVGAPVLKPPLHDITTGL